MILNASYSAVHDSSAASVSNAARKRERSASQVEVTFDADDALSNFKAMPTRVTVLEMLDELCVTIYRPSATCHSWMEGDWARKLDHLQDRRNSGSTIPMTVGRKGPYLVIAEVNLLCVPSEPPPYSLLSRHTSPPPAAMYGWTRGRVGARQCHSGKCVL